MFDLTFDQARVLGVLLEKSMTTPENYPMTLNSLVAGANQKNNRHPVTNLAEKQVLSAVNALKALGLIVEVHTVGSRVAKYRHELGEKLGLGKAALALLAELLLRGPQTLGELRSRASRMSPFESTMAVRDILHMLIERDPPLVRHLPPPPGSRADLYVQLLAPDAHPLDRVGPSDEESAAAGGVSLQQRVATLEQQVAELQQAVQRLEAAIQGTADQQR